MSKVRVLPGPPHVMKDFRFTRGTIEDLPKFYPVFKKNLREQFPQYSPDTHDFFTNHRYSKDSIEKYLKDNMIYVFLAWQEDEVVGFFMAYKPTMGVSMAIWTAVVKEYQKRGIATRLIEVWGKTVQEDGGHALQLWTDTRNIDFYQHRGFTLMGEFPKAWYGVDVFMFHKHVQEPNEKNFLRGYLK